MTTFTIIALLVITLSLLAWIACLLRHDAKQESFINHLVSRILEEEEELEASHQFQSDLQADISELNRELQAEKHWIESLQAEILNLEDQVRDLNNLRYIQLAEIDQLKWDIGTYESVCNPNEELEEELAVARQCIWDKGLKISENQKLLHKVAEELYSLAFQDEIRAREVFLIHDLIRDDEIPF